jgi:hypothetical protein
MVNIDMANINSVVVAMGPSSVRMRLPCKNVSSTKRGNNVTYVKCMRHRGNEQSLPGSICVKSSQVSSPILSASLYIVSVGPLGQRIVAGSSPDSNGFLIHLQQGL